MQPFARNLERYLSSKGLTMPYVCEAANDAGAVEEMSLTAAVMSTILNVPMDDCVEYVNECVAADDYIFLNDIENYIKEMEQ